MDRPGESLVFDVGCDCVAAFSSGGGSHRWENFKR